MRFWPGFERPCNHAAQVPAVFHRESGVPQILASAFSCATENGSAVFGGGRSCEHAATSSRSSEQCWWFLRFVHRQSFATMLRRFCYSWLQIRMEQNVDIPVPGRGGRISGLQGFPPGQSPTALHSSEERISERIAEQIVDIPSGGLQDFRPGQSSCSSSHVPAGENRKTQMSLV